MNGKWLSILQGENPVGFPTSQYAVDDLPAVGEEALPGSDRQLIGPAEMKNLSDVEIAKAVISLNAESGEQRGAIGERRFVQDIGSIGAALGPGEIGESLQTGTELTLIVELERVVVTIARKTRIDKAGGEIGIG